MVHYIIEIHNQMADTNQFPGANHHILVFPPRQLVLSPANAKC
jgi:hypothetical protein